MDNGSDLIFKCQMMVLTLFQKTSETATHQNRHRPDAKIKAIHSETATLPRHTVGSPIICGASMGITSVVECMIAQ